MAALSSSFSLSSKSEFIASISASLSWMSILASSIFFLSFCSLLYFSSNCFEITLCAWAAACNYSWSCLFSSSMVSVSSVSSLTSAILAARSFSRILIRWPLAAEVYSNFWTASLYWAWLAVLCCRASFSVLLSYNAFAKAWVSSMICALASVICLFWLRIVSVSFCCSCSLCTSMLDSSLCFASSS